MKKANPVMRGGRLLPCRAKATVLTALTAIAIGMVPGQAIAAGGPKPEPSATSSSELVAIAHPKPSGRSVTAKGIVGQPAYRSRNRVTRALLPASTAWLTAGNPRALLSKASAVATATTGSTDRELISTLQYKYLFRSARAKAYPQPTLVSARDYGTAYAAEIALDANYWNIRKRSCDALITPWVGYKAFDCRFTVRVAGRNVSYRARLVATTTRSALITGECAVGVGRGGWPQTAASLCAYRLAAAQRKAIAPLFRSAPDRVPMPTWNNYRWAVNCAGCWGTTDVGMWNSYNRTYVPGNAFSVTHVGGTTLRLELITPVAQVTMVEFWVTAIRGWAPPTTYYVMIVPKDTLSAVSADGTGPQLAIVDAGKDQDGSCRAGWTFVGVRLRQYPPSTTVHVFVWAYFGVPQGRTKLDRWAPLSWKPFAANVDASGNFEGRFIGDRGLPYCASGHWLEVWDDAGRQSEETMLG